MRYIILGIIFMTKYEADTPLLSYMAYSNHYSLLMHKNYVPAFFMISLVTLAASFAPPLTILDTAPSGLPSGSFL